MKRKILVRLPKLDNRGGDLSLKWFVFYSVRNPKTGKMERFKHHRGLHKCKTLESRYAKADEIIKDYTEKLKAGWTPFDNDNEVIYQDQLEYKNIAEVYGRKRIANHTFGMFASRYVETLSGLEPETIRTYTSKLRKFNQWLSLNGWDKNDITSISPGMIDQFFAYLINDRKLSRRSIIKYRQILIKTWEYAIKEKAVKTCPVQDTPACTREVDQAARPIQEFDIKTFLNAIDETDPQLGLYIRFEYNCFIRPAELRFMKIKWIDFGVGTVTIPKEILKTKHDRISVVPAGFLFQLRNHYYLHHYKKEYYVFGKDRKPGSQHVGKNNFRYRFVKIRKQLNMPVEYKLYSWKHSGNVKAEQMDMPMIDRMFQNGHTSIKTTEVYTRNRIGKSGNAFKNFESI